jgi:transposase-like protein
MNCPKCNSSEIQKIGKIPTCQGKKQRYRCRNCGKTFYIGQV